MFQVQQPAITESEYAQPVKVTHSTQSSAPQKQNLESMLGHLQADMSKQGVNTSQKGCCSACDKPIVGQVITALGKTWHPEHFVCAHCNQELGTRNFFERDGKPYCEPDYHNLFSPRCAYCNGPILDVRRDKLASSTGINVSDFAEMRDRTGQDLAHGPLLLRPMRQAIRRGRLPWARRQTFLSRRLLRLVRSQVRSLQSGHHGKLHFRP